MGASYMEVSTGSITKDELLDLVQTTPTWSEEKSLNPRPKPIEKKIVIPLSDKEKLQRIVESLEDVRLNLDDSSGNGWLFNAQAHITSYIRMMD